MLVGALVTFVLVIIVSLVAFWQAGCPKGGFQCRDGQCLARSRRCDNEDNCSEREDEEDCMLPDDVDVKKLSFPSTNNAPCNMCVCPSPYLLRECSLPSPPHQSLMYCLLNPGALTRDEEQGRARRSASYGLHHTSPAAKGGRGGRKMAGEREVKKWIEGRKLAEYRVSENGMAWNVLAQEVLSDAYEMQNETQWKVTGESTSDRKKCKRHIVEWKNVAARQADRGWRDAFTHTHDGRHLAHITKSPEADRGSVFKHKCVPRCLPPPSPPPPPPPRQEQRLEESDCRHGKRQMDRKPTSPAVFLNPFHKTKPWTLRNKDVDHVTLRDKDGGVLGPYVRGSKDIVGTEPNRHYKEKAQSEFLDTSTDRRADNAIVTAHPRTHSRRKRQGGREKTKSGRNLTVIDLQRSLREVDTDDNTTTIATLPANINFDNNDNEEKEEEEEEEEEEEKEEAVDGLKEEQLIQGGGKPEPRNPAEFEDQADGEVKDSCHCELSNHLTCVGAHLRNISDRIFGVIKHLTVTRDDALTLEDETLMRHNSLGTLSLTSGGLITLPRRLFVNLKFLEHLYLTGNMIEAVEEESCIGLTVLKVFFINRNKLTRFDLACFNHTPALQDLNMGHNKLTLEGQIFPYLPHLTSLYINSNLITNITGSLLAHLPHIRTLDLRDNLITRVDAKAFTPLVHLRLLMMSGNRLTSVAGLFRGLHSLAMLKLEELDLHDIHTNNFHVLPGLKFVYFDTFRYCRYVPTATICLPNFDGITSTEDLLGWRTLRVAVWVIAVATIAANALVIFCRAISRKDNKTLKLFIKNLAAADLLMGVYLLVIGVQDAATRGKFNSHALQWADSYTCVFAGVLAMVSSETSVFIISFMSLERYLYISEAFHDRTLSLRGARLCLAAIWLTSISLAFFPILWIRSFYGNNSVCFPLYINEPYLAGWQYSAFIFLGLNFVSMMVVLASYVGLFLNIRGTRLSTSRSNDEMNFAFRFFFIVITNCFCWLPIMCVKIAALAHIEVHQGVYAWLVVLVLPINSALNPALYTFSTSQFQLQMNTAVTTFRRLHHRHNSDTEALRHSSTRTGGSHHHPHHLHHHPHHLHNHPHAHSTIEPHPAANTTPMLVNVRDIHLKNLPSPEPVVTLSPHDLRNGLLLNVNETPPLPEESSGDGGGDDTSDDR